jgi:type III secretory pathway lipoprotein EscJ
MLCMLVLSGCNEKLVADGQSLAEANEIISVLADYGLHSDVQRESGGRSRYGVAVESEDYVTALAVLQEKGLPKAAKSTFLELTESKGFLPPSREIEAIRLDYALSLNIEETLLNLPEVVGAQVLLRQASVGKGEEASVSVVLQVNDTANVNTDEVLKIVKAAVSSITPEKVDVIVRQAKPKVSHAESVGGFNDGKGKVVTVPLVPFLFTYRIPNSDYVGLALLFVGGLVLFAVAGGIVGYWFASTRREQGLPNRPSITGEPALRLPRPPSEAVHRSLIGGGPNQ